VALFGSSSPLSNNDDFSGRLQPQATRSDPTTTVGTLNQATLDGAAIDAMVRGGSIVSDEST
jgi:hypothetical protein